LPLKADVGGQPAFMIALVVTPPESHSLPRTASGGGNGTRLTDATASLGRMLVRSSGGLMSVLAVLVRGLGMLLASFMLANVVMVGSFQVVVRGGRMVGGGLMMMFAPGVFRYRRHYSRLLGGHWVLGRFGVGRAGNQLDRGRR
jgi:hypothetical protein